MPLISIESVLAVVIIPEKSNRVKYQKDGKLGNYTEGNYVLRLQAAGGRY
jgi:hypothetical protein